VQKRYRSISSIRVRQSISFARNAASIPIIKGDLILINTAGVNVACLSGLSPFDFEDVVVYDGANHPEDTYSRKPRVAGHLKFISIREAAMAGGTKVD
jgi:hypothetical protein